MSLFHDRIHAGQLLADALVKYQAHPSGLILGLPRGGVPVAFEVAQKLKLPLDIVLVRKLGVPWQEELAMGAIAQGGFIVLNHELINGLSITPEQINLSIQQQKLELERRLILYRKQKTLPDIKDKTIILIDDGLATGASMEVAVMSIKKSKPKYILVAVPVASMDAYKKLKNQADEVVSLYTPEPFYSVGMHYSDFSQTTDDEVISLLNF